MLSVEFHTRQQRRRFHLRNGQRKGDGHERGLPFDWSRMAELQICIDHRLCVKFNPMHCREMGSAHRMKDPAFVGIT